MAQPRWNVFSAAILALLSAAFLPGASGALSLAIQESVEWLVLAARRHLVRSAFGTETVQIDKDQSLASVERYAPRVRDFSLCSSLDGPHCALVRTSSPSVAVDGAVFDDVPLTLLATSGVPSNLLPGNKVNCGTHRAESCYVCTQGRDETACGGDCGWFSGMCVDRLKNRVSCGFHRASECSECPQGHGQSWCNGDCFWRNEQCVESNQTQKVKCGAHNAPTCADCPQGRGEMWCHGDCAWTGQECVHSADCEWDDNGTCHLAVNCGSHRAINCSDCPRGNGQKWCNGDCYWHEGQCLHLGSRKSVNCGGHRAASCSDCTGQDEGRLHCNGDCAWNGTDCLHKR